MGNFSIDTTDSAQARRAWIKKGAPRCAHERHQREILFGADSGDEMCIECGLTWSRTQPIPAPTGGLEAPSEDV